MLSRKSTKYIEISFDVALKMYEKNSHLLFAYKNETLKFINWAISMYILSFHFPFFYYRYCYYCFFDRKVIIREPDVTVVIKALKKMVTNAELAVVSIKSLSTEEQVKYVASFISDLIDILLPLLFFLFSF